MKLSAGHLILKVPKVENQFALLMEVNSIQLIFSLFQGEEAVFAGFLDGTVLLSELNEQKKANIIRHPTGSEVSAIAVTSNRSHILIGDAKGNVLWSSLWAGEI